MVQEASRSYLTRQGHVRDVSFSVTGYPKDYHAALAGDVVVQFNSGADHPVAFLSPKEAIAWANALMAAAEAASK
jgi:hypothetical protein